jgi:subtilisin family serine protease
MALPRVRRALPLALALLLFPVAAATADVVPDQVVVRFAADTSDAHQAGVLADAGARDSAALPLADTRVAELPPGTNEQRAADQLQARPDVLWAEPNYVVETDSTPDDPAFPSLWGLSNTGQSAPEALAGLGYVMQGGLSGIDIGAPAAWNITTGASAVKVGVVDTGIAAHRDLAVDGALSHDFRSFGAARVADPRADADGHGTHVAGTIGATGDNGLDVTGVSWDTTLVALRALDAGSGTSADVAAAFAYAGDHHIPIVNASLGSPDRSTAIADAIRTHPDTLYVVAAGNDGVDVDTPGNASYPCDLPDANLICVASLDNDGARSYYSNYGATSVDLAAPGNGVLSTYPTYTTPLSSSGTWTHDAGWSYSGSTWTGDVTSTASGIQSPAVNLSTASGCSVRLTLASSIPATSNAVSIERSIDGSTWEQIGAQSTPTSARSLAFPADADEQSSVRIRVVAKSGGASVPAGVSVKDLQLRCLAGGASSATATLSGTSMATPMVAGVAALLLAAQPSATVAQLRTALLSTVTPLSSLSCSTVTGGTVNAAAALVQLTTGVTPAAGPACGSTAAPASGGGGGGGGGGAPTTPAPPVNPPITVPTPVPAAAAQPAAPAAAAPTASLRILGGRLVDDGLLTVRVAVSARASVHAGATAAWKGGRTTLAAATRDALRPGDVATLRLRLAAHAKRAIRRAHRAGRRITVDVTLTVTGADGASRQVERALTVR